MSILLFLKRFWPYIALVLALAALFVAKQYDVAKYERLSSDYANYRTATANAMQKAAENARAELERQIRERVQIDKHNSEVLHDFEASNAALVADRDHARELARRLLAAGQGGRAAGSGPVPETGDRPSASPAGEDSGAGLASRLARVAAECRGNAAQLDALLSQLRPQLEAP